eukprot:m.225208 g.225208  ORF g.225208 m.225208 type:complete len:357 (+) comp40011_c1_seq4:39-1109(+)
MALYGVRTWVVCVALAVVQIGFGGYGVIVKKFAEQNKANPLIFCFIRDGCCFPVLMLCALVAERKLFIPRGKKIVVFFFLGTLGMFGNQFFYIMGVYYAGADIASIFQPVIPVWTALFAIVFRIEKPMLRTLYGIGKLLGIVVGAAGACVMLLKNFIGHHDENNHKLVGGILFLTGNTICMAIFVLVQKKYVFEDKQSHWSRMPVSVTAWCYFFGTVDIGLASLFYVIKCNVSTCSSNPWHIPKEESIPIVYAIFIASALCYLLITWANMHISSTVVTAFWPLQVPVAVVLAYFLLGETLGTLDYVGGALIIVGLFLVVVSNHVREKRAAHSQLSIQGHENAHEKANLLNPKSFEE